MIWVDLFTEYVMDKTIIIRTAQTIVEGYEECHFRRFEAREAILDDVEPEFMPDLFGSSVA